MARSHSTDTIYTQMTLFSHCLQHMSYTGQMHGVEDLCMDGRSPQVLDQAISGS